VEIDGIHVMKIAPAEDGGSLKNAHSERDVPLHPALVEQGFLAFVRSRGDGPLFYGTQGAPRSRRRGSGTDTHRHASKGVSNRLAGWIRSEGFNDHRKAPSHAFRHWFKTTCARLGIQERVADAIQGHVGNQTAADTYVHIDVAMKADAIGRIPVPQVKANGVQRTGRP
jgi:integrase